MLYDSAPKNFNPSFDVVSCFVRRNGDFLALLRQPDKPQGNKWGVPAGKVDQGETRLEALTREVWEETGLDVDREDFDYFKTLFVRYPDQDFVYHMYSVQLPRDSIIILTPKEHKGYQWVTPRDSLKLLLVDDMKPCIEMYFDL